MRIAMLQMEILPGEKEKNILHAMNLMDQAVHNADVIVLPEMWTVGYDFHRIQEHVTHLGDELMQRLSTFCRFNGITLVAGSLPFQFPDAIYNTTFIFGPHGNIQSYYRKVHLFSNFVEAKVMRAGTEYICTSIGGVESGFSICYELRFPEMFRELAKSGATLIFMAASWPAERIRHWLILNEARAVENEVFMCSVNAVGHYKGIELCGHSLFVSPDGTILAEGGEREQICYADYDHDAVLRQRKSLAVWSDIKDNVPLYR